MTFFPLPKELFCCFSERKPKYYSDISKDITLKSFPSLSMIRENSPLPYFPLALKYNVF